MGQVSENKILIMFFWIHRDSYKNGIIIVTAYVGSIIQAIYIHLLFGSMAHGSIQNDL